MCNSVPVSARHKLLLFLAFFLAYAFCLLSVVRLLPPLPMNVPKTVEELQELHQLLTDYSEHNSHLVSLLFSLLYLLYCQTIPYYCFWTLPFHNYKPTKHRNLGFIS